MDGVRAEQHWVPRVGAAVEIEGNLARVPTEEVASPPPAVAGRYVHFVKPGLDILGALVLLAVTAPILIVAAIAVMVTMGGPR